MQRTASLNLTGALLVLVATVLLPMVSRPATAAEATAPVRIGVAGLTHGHADWILELGERTDVELAGIAEANQELARRLIRQHGLSMDLVYPDLETMLDAVRPDAVTAFGSIREHLDVVEACAPRGIHVMVEKPLAMNLQHARRMAALATEHGIHLLTNYETTWYGTHRRLYEVIHEENALGAIRKMVIHDGHPGPVAIGVDPEFLEWLTDPEQNGGGALIDFGCYGADLMTWLMRGERPLTVTAVTQNLQPDVYPKVEDEATVILTYPKAQGIIQASWNWPFNRKDTHVYGEHGEIHALDRTRLRVRVGDGAPKQIEVPPPPGPLDDPFAYLAAVVRGRITPGPADLSALPLNVVVVEILDAAARSAREGRRIELPRAR